MTGSKDKLTSEWSVCLIAGISSRTDPGDISDKRINTGDPRVESKILNCRKKPRRTGGYINGECAGCLLKMRLNLECL